MQFATGPHMCSHVMSPCILHRRTMSRTWCATSSPGRVAFQRRREPNWRPGITVHHVGGHSMGLQFVRSADQTRLGGGGLGRHAFLREPGDDGRRSRSSTIWVRWCVAYRCRSKAQADTPGSTSCRAMTRWCWTVIRRPMIASRGSWRGSTWHRAARPGFPSCRHLGRPLGARQEALCLRGT